MINIKIIDIFKEQPPKLEADDDNLVPADAVMTSNDVTKEDDGIGDEDWNMLANNKFVTS